MISTDSFFALWEQYNNAIWPTQIVTYVLGILSVVLAVKKWRFSDKAITGTLSLLWLWNGVATFIVAFGDLSTQYYAWGALWIIQSLVFLYVGFRSRLAFGYSGRWYNVVGVMAIAYALGSCKELNIPNCLR